MLFRSRQSEQRFQSFADAVPEVFWMSDLRTRELVYLNSAFERIWGTPTGDLRRCMAAWLESIHPDDRDRVVKEFDRWAAGPSRAAHAVEYRIVRVDPGVVFHT